MDEKEIDVLLEMHRYNTEAAEKNFDFRERITASTMIAYAALSTAIVSLKFSFETIPIAIVLMILARFSEFFTIKFYERAEFYRHRARLLRDRLDQDLFGKGRGLQQIFSDALEAHKKNFTISTHKNRSKNIIEVSAHGHWAIIHRIFFFVGLIFVFISAGRLFASTFM